MYLFMYKKIYNARVLTT